MPPAPAPLTGSSTMTLAPSEMAVSTCWDCLASSWSAL